MPIGLQWPKVFWVAPDHRKGKWPVFLEVLISFSFTDLGLMSFGIEDDFSIFINFSLISFFLFFWILFLSSPEKKSNGSIPTFWTMDSKEHPAWQLTRMVSLPVFLCGIMEILNDGFLSSCAKQNAMAWVSLDRVTFSRRPKNVLNVSINVIQPSMVECIDVSEGLGW